MGCVSNYHLTMANEAHESVKTEDGATECNILLLTQSVRVGARVKSCPSCRLRQRGDSAPQVWVDPRGDQGWQLAYP